MSRIVWLMRIVAVSLLVATVAGCGGGASGGGGGGGNTTGAGGGGGAANTSDMCTLLTNSEVEAAAGVKVTSSGHGELDAAHYCEWKLEPGKNAEGVNFNRLVAITKYAGSSSYDVAAAAGSPVSGVGDKAAIVDHVVNVLKGDTHFAVAVVLHQPGDEDATLLAKEDQVSQDLAKRAADRL